MNSLVLKRLVCWLFMGDWSKLLSLKLKPLHVPLWLQTVLIHQFTLFTSCLRALQMRLQRYVSRKPVFSNAVRQEKKERLFMESLLLPVLALMAFIISTRNGVMRQHMLWAPLFDPLVPMERTYLKTTSRIQQWKRIWWSYLLQEICKLQEPIIAPSVHIRRPWEKYGKRCQFKAVWPL